MDADRAAEATSNGRVATMAIECHDIVKTYRSRQGEVAAVRGVDLAIGEGEFFSMLGPSGCGKTTTLRMIGGFEDPTSGRILLQGRDVTSAPPDKRDVNMVFQNYALFPHLNVWQNVAFGLRRRRTPKPEIRKRVAEMLEMVQLTGRESRNPNELSGGQQQRVALARALVNRPRALLLDEPLGALDLKLRQAMQSEIKRIQREVGITFVYVTHDQSEALTMSDRLAVMNDGVIEQLGTPPEVYERPETRFVAGFIGTSNVLSAEVTRVAGDVALIDVSPDERIALPLEPSLRPREHVDITVRPEKITISSSPREAESIVRGRVTEVAYLGTSTSYRVVTSLHAEVVAFRQNDTGVAPLTEGDEVWLSWDASNSFRIPAEVAA